MGAWNGAFDNIVHLPAGDSRYESPELPGWIPSIRSFTRFGYFHPIDKRGLPMFHVVLNKDGIVAINVPK